jgi:hypothetical protein
VRATVSSERELARRVAGLTAGLVALVALVSWVLGGPGQAAGVVAGGAISIANFLWLSWTAGRALRPAPAAGASARRLLWLGAVGPASGWSRSPSAWRPARSGWGYRASSFP